MKKITLKALWTYCVALEKASDKLETAVGDLGMITYYPYRFTDDVILLLDRLVLAQVAKPTTTLQVETPGALAFKIKVPVDETNLTVLTNKVNYSNVATLTLETQGKTTFLVIDLRFD